MTWIGNVGIFDRLCGVFTNRSYNPDNVDLSGLTEGVNYLILKVKEMQEPETPDVGIKKLPKRKNFATGFGKVELKVIMIGYVIRRENGAEIGSAITKYNKIKKFSRQHDESGDESAYLVIRVANPTSGNDYEEFEDDEEQYDVKFLKGKIASLNKKFSTYGYIEYTLQFQEAWIP